MAQEEVILKLQADIGNLQKELETVNKGVADIGKTAKKTEKNTGLLKKGISGPCKAAAKRKFKVWPSAYASGWGVRCTKAGGPSKFGG